MNSLKERLIGALQKDRLSDFQKEANLYGSGCFYYALISAHNWLYPDELIDQSISTALMHRPNIDYGIKPSDVFDEIHRLEPLLHVAISHISTPDKRPLRVFRKKFHVPPEITISKFEEDPIFIADDTDTYILYLNHKTKKSAHYLHVAENVRFQSELFHIETLGGQPEYDLLKENYFPGIVFKISKSK